MVQSRVLVDHYCKDYKDFKAFITMFPFLLASNLPDSLLLNGDTKVELTNFDPDNIDDIEYDEFLYWMDEQRALFENKDEVDPSQQMLALEKECELFLKSKVLKPEESEDPTA